MTTPNKDLQALLRKYWAGETSLEEEKAILEHFAGEDQVDEEDGDALYFQFLQDARTLSSDKDYTDQLPAGKSPARRLVMWSRVAAVAAMFIGLVWVGIHNYRESSRDTYQDPAAAWETTKAALALVSHKMQEGTKSLEPIQELDKLQIIRDN